MFKLTKTLHRPSLLRIKGSGTAVFMMENSEHSKLLMYNLIDQKALMQMVYLD
jgi:hypothetical protein